MTLTRPAAASGAELQELLDSLLYSVSHDLRSPLLSMSLSSELIAGQVDPHAPESSSATVALEALQHGAKDLERMLQAIALLSRARRRPLDAGGVHLQALLGGQVVISDEANLGQLAVAVDPMVVHEVLDVVGGHIPLEVRASVEERVVVLRLPGTDRTDALAGSFVRAVVGSLQAYAGTEIERLAASEIALTRQGAHLSAVDGSVVLWLPLVEVEP